MPITAKPLSVTFPLVLDVLILQYLPFSDLNRYAESWNDDTSQAAETLLKKRNKHYINIVKMYREKNWASLTQHLKQNVLSKLGITLDDLPSSLPSEKNYTSLCEMYASVMLSIIRNDFYLAPANTDLDNMFVRDCIFHYVQAKPNEAGLLLNQHVWRFWHSYVSELLVAYGANIEMVHGDVVDCSLLQALRWSGSSVLIELFIEKKVNYQAFQETRHGVPYTPMLIAALESPPEHLKAIARAFSEDIPRTLTTLQSMLETNSNHFYTRTSNNQRFITSDKKEKKFYSIADIVLAQKKMREFTADLILQPALPVTETLSSSVLSISPVEVQSVRLS